MSNQTITVDEQRLRDVLTAVLVEGNPVSTIEWEFSSGFDDINQCNREDFCEEVVRRLRERREGELRSLVETGEMDRW